MGRQRNLNLTARPPFPSAQVGNPALPLGVSQLLSSSFRIRPTRVLCPILPMTNLGVFSLVCTHLFSTCFARQWPHCCGTFSSFNSILGGSYYVPASALAAIGLLFIWHYLSTY